MTSPPSIPDTVAGGGDPTTPDLPAPLALVRRLAESLRQAEVRFCHWKSNEAIALSEAGINDLDLLVAEGDAGTARAVLARLGFVRAVVPPDRRVPGMDDFFGFDAGTGRLVQVQLHEQLVLGDDMTKNFRLPVEAGFLASVRPGRVLPVPAPEFEYVVFVLRMAVKHGPLDAVLMGKGRLTRTERSELAYLEERVDRAALAEVLEREFPWLDPAEMAAMRRGLEPDATVLARVRAGRGALTTLARFGRRPPLVDLWVRVGRRLRRRLAPTPRAGRGPGLKTPAPGGAVVAFIGGDGSGKSSAVAAVLETLSRHFRVTAVHMGKPPRSLPSRAARRLVRSLGLEVSGEAFPAWSEFPSGYPGAGLPLGNLLVARDRLRQARRARSLAEAGWIVLSDRYPVAELSSMDAPRNRAIADRFPSLSTRLLARLEERYYAALPPPDLRLVFRVSPEVARARRPEQDAEFVSVRAGEVMDVSWEGATEIAADATADEVRGAALGAVWGFLVASGAAEEGRLR